MPQRLLRLCDSDGSPNLSGSQLPPLPNGTGHQRGCEIKKRSSSGGLGARSVGNCLLWAQATVLASWD